MGVPKRKTSKSRKRRRQAGKQTSLSQTTRCPHCHRPKLSHRVCPHCGYYKGKAVIPVEGK